MAIVLGDKSLIWGDFLYLQFVIYCIYRNINNCELKMICFEFRFLTPMDFSTSNTKKKCLESQTK